MEDQKELISDLFQEDKFLLIVLDACRYDIFKEFNKIKGKLKKVKSRASHTYVWLQRNFNNYYPDIKIYSTHPIINKIGYTPTDFIPTINRNTFDASHSAIWKSTEHFRSKNIIDLVEEVEDWSDFPRTCPKRKRQIFGGESPRKVLEKVDKFYDKQIIWLMFPHRPYIGRGKTLKERYINGAKITLEDLHKWLLEQDLDRKVIVTADHGEIFEPPENLGVKASWKKILRHEPGVDDPRLREIPWLDISKEIN